MRLGTKRTVGTKGRDLGPISGVWLSSESGAFIEAGGRISQWMAMCKSKV